MAQLLKPLKEQLIDTGPPIEVDVEGQVITMVLRKDKYYIIRNLYSFINLNGTPVITSNAPIDDHPEVWTDPRWMHGTVVDNHGETSTQKGGVRVYSTATIIHMRTNGMSEAEVTLRGGPL